MKTLIKNVHVYKDNQMSLLTSVLLDGENIAKVDPSNDEIEGVTQLSDGHNGYLIPGLMDAHVHTTKEGLQDALKFGVTTELEMMGGANGFTYSPNELVADVFSAGMGVTAEGGHPSELHGGEEIPKSVQELMDKMTDEEREEFIAAHERAKGKKGKVETEQDAREFVLAQIENGADYIKIMLDDGKYEGSEDLPILPRNVLQAAVDEAHKNNKLVLAHTLEQECALEAVEMGVDGLAHMFLENDEKTQQVLDAIIDNNVFVIPTLVLNSSICGIVPTELANDPRVNSKLNADWNENLQRSFDSAPYMNFQNSLDTVNYLKQHSVNILAGTDVSQPAPNLGGLAHGASVHHELQLLVDAGFSNAEALNAATQNINQEFNINRGQIFDGLRADLVLLQNNPLDDIQATLDIKKIWQKGNQVY